MKIILIFIFFLLINLFGYIFSKRILKENKLIYLIPYSLCFGSSLYVTILHLFSLAFGVPKATYLTLSLILILSLFIIFKYKCNNSLELGLSKRKFFFIFSFSLLFGVLSLAYLLKFNTYDPGVYQIIGLLSKGDNYPNSNPYGHGTIHIYHNGVSLFASSLKVFSHLETIDSLYPVQTIFIFICPFIIFLLIYSFTKKFSQAILASIIGCFCATLKSLQLFTFFQEYTLNQLVNDFRNFLFWMADSGFVSPTQKAIMSPNSSVAIPLSVFLFYLCTKETIPNKKYFLPILFTSAFLFFSYEAYWLPVFASACMYQAFLIIKNKFNYKQILSSFLLVLLIAMSPLIVGGVIQDKNKNISNYISIDVKTYTYSFGGTLQLVYPPEWFEDNKNIVFSEVNDNIFYKVPIFSKYTFHEFGLPLIILPIIMLWLILSRNTQLFFFLLSGIFSFLIPFLITYNLMEIETHRFLIYSRFVFSILFGAFLGFIFFIKLPRIIYTLPYRIAIILLTIALVIPGIHWMIPLVLPNYEYRSTMLSEADKKALSWLDKNTKSDDIGIGPWDVPFKCFELISLAGVYGAGVYTQNIAQEETRKTALSTLNPCLLKELNVRWIYLNEKLFSMIPKDILKQLEQEGLLTKRFNYKNNEKFRIIYEFKPPHENRHCTNNYVWSIGRIIKGRFIALKPESQTTFLNKTSALNKLKEITSSLDKKEVMWYGIEAIRT